MKNIKVLGSGCASCDTSAKLIQDVADATGCEITLEKVTDLSEILAFGVLSTPGIVIDEQVIHSGSTPSRSMIESWLKQ